MHRVRQEKLFSAEYLDNLINGCIICRENISKITIEQQSQPPERKEYVRELSAEESVSVF